MLLGTVPSRLPGSRVPHRGSRSGSLELIAHLRKPRPILRTEQLVETGTQSMDCGGGGSGHGGAAEFSSAAGRQACGCQYARGTWQIARTESCESPQSSTFAGFSLMKHNTPSNSLVYLPSFHWNPSCGTIQCIS